MDTKLSLGIVFFRKALDKRANSRFIVHAEYNLATKAFSLVKTSFVQEAEHVYAMVNKHVPCVNVSECMRRLAVATAKAVDEGYDFDISGNRLLDLSENDETWASPIRKARSRVHAKRNKHH